MIMALAPASPTNGSGADYSLVIAPGRRLAGYSGVMPLGAWLSRCAFTLLQNIPVIF